MTPVKPVLKLIVTREDWNSIALTAESYDSRVIKGFVKREEKVKILRLKAENFKRLEVVEIKPTGQIVKISGPNKSGKSSVLDSIVAALGGKANVPSKPVRSGNVKSTVTLDLGGIVMQDGHVEKVNE